MAENTGSSELGFLLPQTEEVRREEYETAVAMVLAIKHGLNLTKAGIKHNGRPLFTVSEGVDMDRDVFSSFIDATRDHIFEEVTGNKVVFSSNRDSWNKLRHIRPSWEEIFDETSSLGYNGLPDVRGIITEGKGRLIHISGNHDAGTDFNRTVLKGLPGSIIMNEQGALRISYGGTLREMTNEELAELMDIFVDAGQKLNELEAMSRKRIRPD